MRKLERGGAKNERTYRPTLPPIVMMMPVDLMSSPSRESDTDLSDSCGTEYTTKTKPCSGVLKCPTFTKDNVTLANADCLYVLKHMQDKTAALVVIDPPYGGHTHNQQGWDVAWSDEERKDILRETYRVLIPGGHVVVFSSGKSTLDINMAYIGAHKQLFGKKPSYYPMVWVHNSRDSSRAHGHVLRSQFESMHVYYREGEGKLMEKAGTFAKSYAFDEHVGRHNVFHIDKDDCHKKPYPIVQRYFADKRSEGKCCSTFDYTPEALMRALIRDYTKPEHTVVDLCMRHGITAVAAELERRSCIGIEIEKQSYSLTVRRFKDQFGDVKSPVLAALLTPTVATAPEPESAPKTAPKPESAPESAPKPAPKPAEDEDEDDVVLIDDKPAPKKRKRSCGTPGCLFADGHIGLCSCAALTPKRSRVAA